MGTGQQPDTCEFDPGPWRGEILSFVLKMGASSDAEDIVQEAFVRAIARPPAKSPRAYLYRTVMRLLADRGRARARQAKTLSRTAARIERRESPNPADTAEHRDLAAAALRAAHALPPKQRAALLLRVRGDMEYDELAEALETSAATARQHVYLAAKAIRVALASSFTRPASRNVEGHQRTSPNKPGSNPS